MITVAARAPLRRTITATVLLLASACGSGGGSQQYTEVTSAPQPMSGRSGPWFAVTDDAPHGAVVVADAGAEYGLEDLLTTPADRSRLEVEISRSDAPLLVHVNAGRDGYRVDGPLPNGLTAGANCSNYVASYVDSGGTERTRIAAGLCGNEGSYLGFEFTADGVNIADRGFLEEERPASPPGTVGVDRIGQAHLPSGREVAVNLDLLPAADWNKVDPDLREVVCFDVTVRAGDGEVVPGDLVAGLDPRGWEDPVPETDPGGTVPGDRDLGPRVIPRIEVTAAGEAVPVHGPGDGLRRPFVPQPSGSTVVWSYGPIDLAEWQPDQITVTAVYGEIVDWDVSARRC